VPSLGDLLRQGKNNLDAWWLSLPTIALLVASLLLLTFIGDSLRDAYDTEEALSDAAAASPLLSIDKLSIDFGPHRVVHDLSLDIHAGEKVGLVGESGSGKSVTALSLLRLVAGASYQGAIRFRGDDLLRYTPRQMQALRGSSIAMIFQEPMTSLDPLYTVGDQVAEVLTTHEAMPRRAAFARAVELLGKTGIPEPARHANAFPHQLSGGQRQRAMIAMALACRPSLLIADEPTTALDVTIQAQVLELLDELQREYRMAVLFITHDLNLARRFTSRVGVMERGVLVESGPTGRVLSEPAHPYTRRLVDSRPRREVEPLAGDRTTVLAAESLSVEFAVRTPGSFRRRRFRALADASLRLARGETLGIVGESGSGKTTLAMALLACSRSLRARCGSKESASTARAGARWWACASASRSCSRIRSHRSARAARSSRSSARASRCMRRRSTPRSGARRSSRCSPKSAWKKAPFRACSAATRTSSRAGSGSASRWRAR
jgi:microcin C transport system ATP-binding protein